MRTLVTLALLVSLGCASGPSTEERGTIRVSDAMSSGSDDGFARATETRPFVFPDDHGPHPDYRTEWWYFTGNLRSEAGASFGYQFTIFRHALAAEVAPRESRWGARDVWFAHFGLGEERTSRFRAFERFERGALGLAGARARPFAAWVGDWRVESTVDDGMFPLRLVAIEGSVSVDLVLERAKPFVLQGEDGLSRKGPEPGNASYYYAATRLRTRGSVTAGGIEHAVSGSSWLDREWSTSALSEGQVGWDWFSIQLDDGRDLMLYRMRRADGTTDPFNSGSLIGADGRVTKLGADSVRYAPGRRWTSPTGAAYPVAWTLNIEPLGLELDVAPMLEASEMNVAVRYWEGAIRVQGHGPSGDVSGVGFLEMTGYDNNRGRVPK